MCFSKHIFAPTVCAGTWRENVVESADKFLRVSSNVPTDFAATVQVNPPTAYRMLKDFVQLQPGMYTCGS